VTDELDVDPEGPIEVEVEPSTWRAIPDALLFDTRVGSDAKVVWAALLSYGESVERCFPGIPTLAERFGVSVSTIQRRIRELRDTGWIEVFPRFTKTAGERMRQTSNGYLVRRTRESDLKRPGVRSDRGSGVSPDRGPGSRSDRAEERAMKNESKKNEKSLVASAPSADVVKLDAHKELAVARDKVSRELLNRWWEAQVPRPAQPYIACLKVVSRMLEVGWSPDDVFFALSEAPVVSTGALTMALKMRRKSSAGTQTQTLLSMMVTLDGMSVEDQEIWWKTEGPGRLHG
jgi:Helix-turn-helix domain